VLDLDPIRRRAEYTTSNLWTKDTFALLNEVEHLRAEAIRVEECETAIVNILESERDAARTALGKVVMMWDEQVSQGFPFLANSDLVPALREILAGYDYDHEI